MKKLNDSEVIRLYKEEIIGMSEIGSIFGCGYGPIKRILLKNNILIRPRGAISGKPNKGVFTKNNIPWNKDLKGIHLSQKSEFKKGIAPWNKGLVLNQNINIKTQIRDCTKGKNWKYSIYKRDNNTCQLCFFHDKGHKGFIGAHHIYRLSDIISDYSINNIDDANNCKLIWDINNGVCLCKNCHKKVHSTTKEVMPHAKS